MSKNNRKDLERHPVKTAILVDGGFYRKRAKALWGNKAPAERADELNKYCYLHLHDKYENRYLYRIFYYDCPPIDKNIYNPIEQKTLSLGKTPEYIWMNEFLKELKHHRKFALRMGRISDTQARYSLKPEPTKKLLRGDSQVSDITMNDLELNLEQKGVDMRIGVDISSLAFKRQINQIILISGDSDFVPAAKQARREGIGSNPVTSTRFEKSVQSIGFPTFEPIFLLLKISKNRLKNALKCPAKCHTQCHTLVQPQTLITRTQFIPRFRSGRTSCS